MKRSAWLAAALGAAVLSTGCVTRRYVITSTPPGAVVYRDGQIIGATPVEEPFIYYGKYRFRLVKDGFEPLDVTPQLVIPWYQYPGLDFVAENIIPFTFRDVQVLHFDLQPVVQTPVADLKMRAAQLQIQSKSIQPPPGVVLPPRPASPPPAPPPGPPVLPQPTAEPPVLPPGVQNGVTRPLGAPTTP